jgi:hypothetical protein
MKVERSTKHTLPPIMKPEKGDRKSKNKFPIDVFPGPLKEIIHDLDRSMNFDIPFTAGAILCASSIAAGNVKLRIKEDFEITPAIWLAIIGPPSSNKTWPVKWALKPIEDKDRTESEFFNQAFDEYEKSKRRTKKKGEQELAKPILKQMLANDITKEKFVVSNYYNQRGLSIYSDELASWLENINKYTGSGKSDNQSFWNSVYSGYVPMVQRMNNDRVIPPCGSCCSLIGTGHLRNLNMLFSSGRKKDGLTWRFLFIYKPDAKRKKFNDNSIDPKTNKNYSRFINELVNHRYTENPTIYTLSQEARLIFTNYINSKLIPRTNDDDDQMQSLYGKFDVHFFKLTLIMHLMHDAFREKAKKHYHTIGSEAVNFAIELTEYFIKESEDLFRISYNPVELLEPTRREFYEALPQIFIRKNAIEIGDKFDISRSSIDRFLGDTQFFTRESTGKYNKRH